MRTALLLLAAALAAGGCSSDTASKGGGSGGGDDESALLREGDGTGRQGSHVAAAMGGTEGGYEAAEAVSDNVRVTWRNLDDRNPAVTQSLVNASSEMGRQLRSGRISSTATRVLSDEDMGALLDELDDIGFFDVAKPGLRFDDPPDVNGVRGIVTVERNGRAEGILMTTGLAGTDIPETYVKSKQLVFAVHSAVQGYEVRVNQDPDRVFQAPKARLRRR